MRQNHQQSIVIVETEIGSSKENKASEKIEIDVKLPLLDGSVLIDK